LFTINKYLVKKKVRRRGELELVYRPPPKANSADIYWDKKGQHYYAVDKRGNERRFTFKLEGVKLNMYLVGEERRCTTAYLEEFNGVDLTTIKAGDPFSGKRIRPAGMTKESRFIEGGRPYNPPKNEHRGRWVFPAYIAHLKREGAAAVMVLDPQPQVRQYYLDIGFEPCGTVRGKELMQLGLSV